MTHRFSRRSLSSPGGFTLIEVLIVMAIIALLVTILVMAVGPTLENARINATRVTINQLNDIIQQRVEAINRADLTTEIKRFAARSGLSARHAEFILRKNLYRQAVPQRIDDLWGLDLQEDTTADNSPIYTKWRADTTSMPPNPFTVVADDATHSSEVLYYSLINGSSVRVTADGTAIALPVLDLGEVNPRHVMDTDSDGLPEFVDAWEQPLQVFNFPTRLFNPLDALPPDLTVANFMVAGLPTATADPTNMLNQDPLDKIGTVSGGTWSAFSVSVVIPPNPTITINALPFGSAAYHDPQRYYVPLIVSAGPDNSIGLSLDTTISDVTDPSVRVTRLAWPLDGMGAKWSSGAFSEDLNDNITNRQR